MVFSSEVKSLHDDGFEGSENESHTYRKVYFANNCGRSTKRCLVTGVINFRHYYSKNADLSLCSNSENSGVTSQDDPYETKEDPKEKSELPHLSEEFEQAVGDPDVKAKRRKLSVNSPSNAKSYIHNVFNSSAPLKEVVSDMPQSASPFFHHPVMCRIVELTRHGVSCCCYLLKKHRGMNLSGDTYDNEYSRCKLFNVDGSEQKEFADTKAIASPVSQESSATKLLVASPDIVASDFGCHQPLKRRWSKSCFVELDEAEMSLRKESKNNPRPVLRYYINRLFKAAGWVVGRRTRSDKYYGHGGFIYISPEGRPIREFCKAWVLCGQGLFIASKTTLPESDVKQWIDRAQFWSDLNDASAKIEEMDKWGTTSALAHCWYLLDPFAKLVLIDKLFSSLKAGKMVLARRSILVNPKRANDAVINLKNVANARYLLGVGHATDQHHGSSLVLDQALVGSNEIDISKQDQHLQAVLVTSPKSRPYNVSKENFGRNINCGEISVNEKSCLALLSLQAYGSDSSSDQIGNYLLDIPIIKPRKPCIKDKNRQKILLKGRLKDSDLLISAIVRKKSCKSTTKLPEVRKISCKSKSFRKYKKQKRSCKLLPRSFNRSGMPNMEAKGSPSGSRTVLSWLINSGFISLNEVIQYRNTEDDTVVKDGLISWEGILCGCCDTVLSLTEFKFHAGFRLNHPCLNLFMESGKPFTLCQLEAWSVEYKARKSAPRTAQVDESDENDDSCGLCGGEGELICCDNCPSTFHQACLYEQEIPEGSWYCSRCTCQICRDVVNDKKPLRSSNSLACAQCERKYHENCLKEKGIKEEASDIWFCGKECYKVYSGLHRRVGLMNLLSDGFGWTILRCVHGDKNVHSAQQFVALKAECNIKLAVALKIMEESFLPMVDARTGIDMVPHVLYNRGIHGTTVAEMPLIATCSKYRRLGMCRHLMNAIEEILRSVKIDKLVMSAVPALVDTWTKGFGFELLEDDERRAMRQTANLMVFPGTVWLKKLLCRSQVPEDLQTGENFCSQIY
ncbi:hypothetical protein DCAR_0625312 [Daucus carota subsp. sativus]|uniref:PHD-type domain-containing protein n=2 Tax=Daucus carota subsp. sativus TaxID=79200 RepID=A0AAF0XFJ2_DAUCS|nr:hypothetical protein DCAR_0625312 [Daucus carota subsp. sativus]